MKTITSVQNAEIKAVAQLSDSKERYKQGRFIAEGNRVCKTLLESGVQLVQLYVVPERLDEVLQWADRAQITEITPAVLKKITQTVTPNGIVGVFEIPKTPSLNNLTTGIVLAQIADPGNMGTLIRTCAALGKKTVIIIEGVDPWNAKVVQASAGTVGKVHIHQLSWNELIKNKKQLSLTALVVKGGKSPQEIDLTDSLLVIGSEAHGIPAAWVADCEQKITLPMPGGIESLNAAVAGSIAMYSAWS